MRKIFHLAAKFIVNDSEIDTAFGSMHQSIKKSSVSKVWIVKIMEEHGIKTFDCYYERNK